MGMGQLQFYKNKYRYPHYSNTITSYGVSMPCTPVGMNLRSGSLRVKGDMLDFMSCNYLQFSRDGVSLYAWIDDVQFHTEDSFIVKYSVDPWRTYRSKIDLGTQFIARTNGVTSKYDRLLGSSDPAPMVESKGFLMEGFGNRVLVVQVRPATGDISSRSPVHPTPYQFYMISYPVNGWTTSVPIQNLLTVLEGGAETTNIVTMYSIPYMNISGLTSATLNVETPSGNTPIEGFKFLGNEDPTALLKNVTPITFDYDLSELLRTEHSVQVVIPEAGVLNIPDELLYKGGLSLRQDVDLFSGASNYMLMSGEGQYYTKSVRGSSISSIPVLSDPMDTYISQNQNALATSLMGDVASLAGGIGMMASAPVTGGIGGMVGMGAVSSGIMGIMNTSARIMDSDARVSNPPAFLGTALASNFNQMFWVVTTRKYVDNAEHVNSTFGYPLEKVAPLVFPSTGFIQTEGCMVASTDGSVPRWAIEEINRIFNDGILVH